MAEEITFWSRPCHTVKDVIENVRRIAFIPSSRECCNINIDYDDEC
jgi:hypothetical protein